MTKLDVLDQTAHFIAAFAILSLFAFGGLIGAALAGAGCGLIREVTEAGGSRISIKEIPPHFARIDPWVDVAFWALGGLTAGAVQYWGFTT